MSRLLAFALVLSAALLAPGALFAQAAAPIPPRPEALSFPPIQYEPPRAADHRVVLKNGMVVFIKEDRALPLVNIAITFRTGHYLDPLGKEGLAGFTGSLMRRGGTKRLTAEELDETFDRLAANAGTGIGGTSGSASLNTLSDNLDQSLALFVEMLKEPRFQEDRLELLREQALQEMRKRNDDSEDIESREWNVLLYGESHFTNRFTTEASLRALTRQDLVDFHKRYVHPANMVVAVSGAFTRAQMIARLEKAFAAWPGSKPTVPPVPKEIASAKPGLYRVEKDVNQGRVTLGLPGVTRDNPDIYALEVMNEILGGGGFISRITRTVRSTEGLAYSAGSGVSFGVWYPGSFRAAFQSKSRSVPYALQLVVGEIQKMRDGLVTAEELDAVQKNLIESFPSTFGSAGGTVGIFASDEYTGRDPRFWQTYREKIRAVTPAEIQRVARKYLEPDKMIVLVVGDLKTIDLGDPKHPVDVKTLVSGPEVVLPLRDPMTMKPLNQK